MNKFNLKGVFCFAFLLLFSFEALAQKTITGLITSDDGKPLAGATITEKGTKNVVVSSATGSFSIKATASKPVLVISYSGYTAKEVAVGSTGAVAVSLSAAQGQLDDVVVIGYGKQRKVTSVGAQSSIGTKDLVQSPVANISNSLVGRLPGLFATQGSGEPGNDASRLLIRGIGTFSGNQSPLILVDGIQVDNYNNISPQEIESITILKDASSTAVYGIRGANGVIIITTKRGRIGAAIVSYTFNNAFNSFTNIRKQMNAYDYANSFNQALKNDAYLTNSTYTPRFTDADLQAYKDGSDPIFHPNVDWYKTALKKISSQQQHNLSISGGTDKVRYAISAGYFNQEGLYKTQNVISDFDPQVRYKRFNFRSNLNYDITSRFRAALDVSTQVENRNGNNADTRAVMNYIARVSPVASPGVIDGKLITLTPGGGSNTNNPITFLYSAGYKTDLRNILNGSLRLEHDLDFITKGLSVHGIIAYQNYSRRLNTYGKTLVTYQPKRLPDNSIIYIQQGDASPFGFASQSPDRNRRTTSEFAFDYRRSFGDHNVTGLLLYNQIKTYDPSFAFGVPNGYQSYVGRLVYDYAGRYLAEISAAKNGTENFAPGRRFGYFPAYSIGWVPTAEKFFPKNKILSFLKLRGSYGEVGNDQLSGDFLTNPNSRFLYRPTAFSTTGPYTVAGYYYFGTVGSNYAQYTALREGRANNAYLTWERAIKTNLGVEATLWNSKINLTVDVFNEKRDNILAVPQTVSSLVGTALAAQNLGKMNNKGYELDLTYRDRAGKFNYWIKGNYSYAHNKVVFQDEVPPTFAYQARTGQAFGQMFGLIAEGFYNTWDEVNDAKRPLSTYVGGNKLQPGDVKYRDVNGDGIIDFKDMVPIGYPSTPEIIYGISFGASWKGLDFSVLLQGADHVSIAYTRYNNQAFFDAEPAAAANYLLESWTQDRYNQGLPINYPRFNVGNGANSFSNNYQSSTLWIKDASYVRLKNAEIGYTFSSSLLRRAHLKSTRVYLNANNLYTWSHVLPGVDPETPNLTSINGNFEPYPLVRTINAGINITF